MGFNDTDEILPDSSRDPNVVESKPGAIAPRLRRLYDSKVSFQEYQYYAQLTRTEQENAPKSKAGKNLLAYLIPSLQRVEEQSYELSNLNSSNPAVRVTITDEEWANASRALRTASAGAVFYLITTDIFGPFGLPYAFATMGWGYVKRNDQHPGVIS